jgi:hypothetical protein
MEPSASASTKSYDPDQLLASLIGKLNLKNDAALSRALEVSPPSALSIAELRQLMGDRRGKFRISDKHFKPKNSG